MTINLPPDLEWASERLRPITDVSCSDAHVFQIVGDEGAFYLKCQPLVNDRLEIGEGLIEEKRRMDWLRQFISSNIPHTTAYSTHQGWEFLRTSALPGVDASHHSHADDLSMLVATLADGLRLLHSVPIANSPFDASLDLRINQARRRVELALVDERDFDDERLGRSASDLLAEIESKRPSNEDLVFTHGDYSLPNIVIDNGRLSGFIDLGRAGIADRHVDLAIAARSLRYNFGEGWEEMLFESYGMTPDREKMEFYLLMDEMF